MHRKVNLQQNLVDGQPLVAEQRVPVGLAEKKDRTALPESDVAELAEGSAKVDKVRRSSPIATEGEP
jgi:hypothetical protein